MYNPNSETELMHWKYIRKYKKNGKWRYVYADKKTHNQIAKNLDNLEYLTKKAGDSRWTIENIQRAIEGNTNRDKAKYDQRMESFKEVINTETKKEICTGLKQKK